MPLSEEELRLLEQMERALVEEDPKFASALRGTSFRRSARRRAVMAGIVFLVGIAGLMVRTSVHRQLVLGEREHGWSDADRAVDRAVRRFGTAAIVPASLIS